MKRKTLLRLIECYNWARFIVLLAAVLICAAAVCAQAPATAIIKLLEQQ